MHLKPAKYTPAPPTKALSEVSANNNNQQQQFTASSPQQQRSLKFLIDKTISNAKQYNNSCIKGRFLHLKTLAEAKSFLYLPVGADNHRHFNRYQKYKTTTNTTTATDNETLFAKLKSMELSIVDLVLLSTIAASEHKFDLALTLAKESLGALNGLKVTLIQQGNRANSDFDSGTDGMQLATMTTSVRLFELGLLVNSNLAAQLKNIGQLRQSIELYTSLCKLATSSSSFPSITASQSMSSSSNHFNIIPSQTSAIFNNGDGSRASAKISKKNSRSSLHTAGGINNNVTSLQQYETRSLLHKFGLNIGNIYYQLGDYKRALKYYRLTLDRLSSMTNLNQHQLQSTSPSSPKLTQQHDMKQLKLKLMNNIGLTLLANGKQNNDGDESLTSLNLLLSDNLLLSSRLDHNQQQITTSTTTTTTTATATATENQEQSDNFIYSSRNSNHHRFGLNLMICYETRANLNGMMGALKSLVKVDICHQYEQVFNFNTKVLDSFKKSNFTSLEANNEGRNLLFAGNSLMTAHAYQELVSKLKSNGSQFDQLRAFGTRNNDEVKTELEATVTKTQTNQNQITRHDVSVSMELKSSGMSGIDQVGVKPKELIGQQVVGLGETTSNRLSLFMQTNEFSKLDAERKVRQVMSSIQGDRLERLIEEKHKQIIHCIIMSCNLMLELEEKIKFQKRTDYLASTSVFISCLKLLSTSVLYKSLIYDLKLNKAIQSLICKKQFGLNEAIEIMKKIDTEQQLTINLSINNTYNQTSMVATNLSLINLFQSTALPYNKDKSDIKKINKSIDLAILAINMDCYSNINWINLANCYYHKGDFKSAKDIYEKIILMNLKEHWEANYNLTIVNRLNNINNESNSNYYKTFEKEQEELEDKVLNVLKKDLEYITKLLSSNLILSCIQLALTYKQSNDNGNIHKSISILKDLISNSKQAPEVHLLASKLLDNTDSQTALNANDRKWSEESTVLLQQANREHPYHLPVLERLIALNINNFDYKSAKELIINCIKNKPDQVRWYQMLAECYRRDADYMKAMKVYKTAIDKFPQDTSCLKALIKLTQELGLDKEKEFFESKLAKLISK